MNNGFTPLYESEEVGYVHILLARRPIAQKMLLGANTNGPEGINFVKSEDLIGFKIQADTNDSSREFQDKADFQFLIENVESLEWQRIQSYAD